MKASCASLAGSQSEHPVLRSVHAHGRLDGLLLTMKLVQVFRNDQPKNLEVTYTFPLPWGAVMLGMDATMNGKRLIGQVMGRRDARERYEDAVGAGDAPVMVEKTAAGLFSASLGSLKPGEEAQIEVSYAQLLNFEQGRIRVVVPTSIAPRYGDAILQGGLDPEQVATPSLLVEHRFQLDVTIVGSLVQARMGSPTHPVSQHRHQDAGQDAVTVSLQGAAWLDRDFVLLLEGLQGRSYALVGPDILSAEGHHAVIASYCPPVPDVEPSPLRLKILVDCSGSMAGDSIAQARDALLGLAAQLNPLDHVSYCRFGEREEQDLKAEAASPRHIKALIKAIHATDADLGGTEMAAALDFTFDLPMGGDDPRGEADVLIITDGEVWDAQNIVQNARRSEHRVYALGVGSAPAESLLSEMAHSTGGACEFVTPHENMEEAIERLLQRIRHTRPVQAELDLQAQPLWASSPPRRLAPGETVHFFMRLQGRPTKAPALLLSGQSPCEASLSMTADDLVARLVAARQIEAMTDRQQSQEMAERYQLVTQQTNLLLVFDREEADKSDGMPALHKVRPMMAAGWGGTGRMRFGVDKGSLQPPVILSSRTQPRSQGNSAYEALAIPSVWRTNRSQADVQALNSMDNFEIPAFLRKQRQEDHSGSADILDSGVSEGNPSAAPAKGAKGETATRVIAQFNRAVASGRPFRLAVREVTDLPLQPWVHDMITEGNQRVGVLLKTWACYLLWLHESGTPEHQLSPAALALSHAQVTGLTPFMISSARQAFERWN